MIEIVEVTTTIGSKQEATELAKQVVSVRLAACVQITGPLQSVYRWQGEICESEEWRCTMKTLSSAVSELIDFINEHHPYEVPETLLVAVQSSSTPYAEWLADQIDKAPKDA